MNIKQYRNNLLAYRVLTIGDLRLVSEEEYNKIISTTTIKDMPNALRPNLDNKEIIVVESHLEGVFYEKATVEVLDETHKVLTLTVGVAKGRDEIESEELAHLTDEEFMWLQEQDEEEDLRYQVELEYLLTDNKEDNPKNLYKILVIEEE